MLDIIDLQDPTAHAEVNPKPTPRKDNKMLKPANEIKVNDTITQRDDSAEYTVTRIETRGRWIHFHADNGIVSTREDRYVTVVAPKPEPEPEPYHLLVDSVRGIYAAQHYATLYGDTLSDEDREILLAGPTHEHYLEVWADTLDGSITIIISNKHYVVDTDNGDIFAVSYEEYLY